MKKDNILDTLSFIIGLVTIILVVVFRNSYTTVFIIASIGSLLYGVLSIINKNNYGYLFTSLGLSLLITMILYMNNVLDRFDSVTFMITGSVFSLMIITLVFDFIKRKNELKKYSLIVEGTVVDLIKNPNTTKEYFQPVYEYILDNEVFQVSLPRYINKFIPNVGDKLKIYVNPDNMEEVYFDKSKKEKITDYGISFFLMISSLIIMITLFL